MPDSTKKKSASETELTPTSITDWRNSRFKLFILPSSENVIKLKRVGLFDLVVQGGIPDTLSGMALEMVNKEKLKSLSAEQLKEYEQVINLVVKAAAVEPKVSEKATDQTLGVREIDWIDRVAIFDWANGAANQLRPFRPEAERVTTAV